MLKTKAILLGLISTSLAGAALGDEAIPNWPAPATWSSSRSHGATALSESNPLPFIAVSPCRIVDTRGSAPIAGGIFTGGSDLRNYAVSGICGIPAPIAALSLNFTVTGPGQTTPGFLTAWPTGGAVPPVSILNWDHVPAQVANAAVVPVNSSTSFTVNVSAPTHVIVDVNGYYAQRSSTGGSFIWNTTTAGFAITGHNVGIGLGGVLGLADSLADDTAGVWGVDGTAGAVVLRGKLSAGVRGDSRTHFGVLGLSEFAGVSGELLNTVGDFIAGGILGSAFGATPPPGAPWGVWSSGNFGATGSKNFVEPHSSDPSKIILYASLEGREVGTYFRGTARTVKGESVIEVPEDFRTVTDEEGLTVQLTTVGPLTMMSVESENLDRIVVRSSKDVTFHYLVQGIRRAFKDFQSVREGSEFMPRSPAETMPLYLTEEAKRRLIANGTYNTDGSVNMQTAERVGWTRVWKEREEQNKAKGTSAD